MTTDGRINIKIIATSESGFKRLAAVREKLPGACVDMIESIELGFGEGIVINYRKPYGRRDPTLVPGPVTSVSNSGTETRIYAGKFTAVVPSEGKLFDFRGFEIKDE